VHNKVLRHEEQGGALHILKPGTDRRIQSFVPQPLPPMKSLSILAGQETDWWVPEPAWTRWWQKIISHPAGNRTPHSQSSLSPSLCTDWLILITAVRESACQTTAHVYTSSSCQPGSPPIQLCTAWPYLMRSRIWNGWAVAASPSYNLLYMVRLFIVAYAGKASLPGSVKPSGCCGHIALW